MISENLDELNFPFKDGEVTVDVQGLSMAIGRLLPRQQTLLKQRYVDVIPYREVGHQLSLFGTAVKSRLHRARFRDETCTRPEFSGILIDIKGLVVGIDGHHLV